MFQRPIVRSVVSSAIALIALAALIMTFLLWSHTLEMKQSIDTSTYQAAFLSNGQVYFGKLSNVGPKYVKLDDVYYLQVQENIQPKAAGDGQADQQNDSQIKLIRLGNEVHQPQTQMTIYREHVLFWENLKADSRVIETINQLKEQANQQ